jgi:integrase
LPKLTDDFLKNAKANAGQRLELRDDKEPGLIFRVTDNGVRTWSVRYRNAVGEQRRKKLGGYPAIGIAKARSLAREAKGLVAVGGDPVAVSKAAKAEERRQRLHTVAGLADAYFAAATAGTHRGGPVAKPKRPGTMAEERRIYDKLVKPTFGDRSVAGITRQEISDFVAKQSRKAKSNGRHCRNIIRQIMNFAVREGVREHNPALDIAVSMPTARRRMLSDAELLAFWKAAEHPDEVEDLALSKLMGIALRMAAVTLQRGGEIVGMRWMEIDRAAKTWLIPAERMKGKKAHLVPLSDLALALLDAAVEEAEGNGSEYVFPSPRSQEDVHIDRRAFSRAMNRLVAAIKMPGATPHDLRRTGATNLTGERIGMPRFIVSQVIAHAADTGGAAAVTGQHYDLNDYLPEKRRALKAWAVLLEEIVSGRNQDEAERAGP